MYKKHLAYFGAPDGTPVVKDWNEVMREELRRIGKRRKASA
jgi:hypothetical protein